MAFGLPVEGEEGPFAGGAVVEATTCRPDDAAEEVVRRLAEEGAASAVVVNDAGVVLGLAERTVVEGAAPGATVADVMRLSPTTVRPSVLLSSLADADGPVLVTDSDGRLRGVVEPDAGEETEMGRLQGTFLDIAHAVEEHFGGRDPNEEEVREFLHERLQAEGRTAEEAAAFLEEMEEGRE
ncbi:MAG: CBS domain-containing protein [Acidimicrobiales bacterium]